jgi:5-methylcytosine-specific restriction endonuclease McrA
MQAYQKQYRQENRTPAEFFCATCGKKIDRQAKSGIATYCPSCAPEAKRQNQLRASARLRERRGTTFATHCHYCNAKFDRPRQRAKTPNRCDECKKDRHRAYIRAYYAKQPRGYDHVRRARKMGLGYERFKVVEIFERDGWKCGICRRPILRRLRYPHSMSASLDHKVPLSKGGHHSRLNTQASHLRCNLRKRTHVAPLGEQIPLPF